MTRKSATAIGFAAVLMWAFLALLSTASGAIPPFQLTAMSFFIGGMPMLFYGDEVGYTNDYSYLNDPGKSYDNRWMHRSVIDWEKNKKIDVFWSQEKRLIHG